MKKKNIFGKKTLVFVLVLLVLSMGSLSSCRSTKKMGCPAYGENKQYFKEKW